MFPFLDQASNLVFTRLLVKDLPACQKESASNLQGEQVAEKLPIRLVF